MSKNEQERHTSGEGVQDAGGDGGEGVRDGGGGSGNGSREEERTGSVTTKGQFILGAIMTIAVITGLVYEIKKYQSPDLHITVDCENWDAPLDVTDELNRDVDYVKQIQSMHTINIHNKGDRKSNVVTLVCADDDAKFKYIEYKKECDDKTTRKRDLKSVSFINLIGSETALAKAWMACEVGRSPAINVLQDPGSSPHIYIKTPVNKFAKFVNKYTVLSIILMASVCFLATPTIKNFLGTTKNFLRIIKSRFGQTA